MASSSRAISKDTPIKEFKRLTLTPRTKSNNCGVCDKFLAGDAHKRKLFLSGFGTGTEKTEAALNLQYLLHEELNFDYSLNYICRSCDSKVATAVKSVKKIKKDYDKTKERIKNISPKQPVVKRLARSTDEDVPKCRKHLFTPVNTSIVTGNGGPPSSRVMPTVNTIGTQTTQTMFFAENTCGSGSGNSVQITIHYPNSAPKRAWLKPSTQEIGRQLALGSMDGIAKAIYNYEPTKESVQKIMEKKIVSELQDITNVHNPCILRKIDKDDLKSFSWKQVSTELKSRMPITFKFLQVFSKKDRDNNLPLLDATCQLVSIYNTKMIAVKHIKTIVLKKCGLKKIGFQSLQRTGDSMVYATANNMFESYGEDYEKVICGWKDSMEKDILKEKGILQRIDSLKQNMESEMLPEQANQMITVLELELSKLRNNMFPGYSFTSDNVDIKFKVRHMTKEKQHQDHHLYHLIAYKHRVSGYHLTNEGRIGDPSTIPLATFLPSLDDNSKLVKEFVVLIGQVLTEYIPELAWFRPYIPGFESHVYSKEMAQKTEKVHLGVLEKNEQKLDDMVDICRFLHKYVPGHCDGENDDPKKTVMKVLSGGDYLTFERHKQALSRQQDGRTPSRRMNGLVPKMEDFHQQAEWLATLAWKQLYNTSSKTEIGTLHAARCAIQARNVSADPKQSFYAATDLMNKFINAYIIAGVLKYFKMKDVKSKPQDHVFTGSSFDEAAKRSFVMDTIKDFIETYIMFKMPDLPDDFPTGKDIKCRFCFKTYKQVKALKKHEEKVHQYFEEDSDANTPAPIQDHVFNYTRTTLVIGLLMKNHNHAIAHGDGERVIRLYKYFLLFYKSSKTCPKYAYGTFETLAQVHCLLTPRLAHQLTWNRFVNYRGKKDTNHPMDLDVEHANKAFKDDIHSFRGEVNEKTINRVSRSLNFTEQIVKNYQKICGVKKGSGKHGDIDTSDDVLALVTQFQSANLFDYKPGRSHKHFENMAESPLQIMDMQKLWKWMRTNLKNHAAQPYYQ